MKSSFGYVETLRALESRESNNDVSSLAPNIGSRGFSNNRSLHRFPAGYISIWVFNSAGESSLLPSFCTRRTRWQKRRFFATGICYNPPKVEASLLIVFDHAFNELNRPATKMRKDFALREWEQEENDFLVFLHEMVVALARIPLASLRLFE